jgi:hypothetical protein
MVVRNAALRMNGLSVGGWHDVIDPERSRMEIVEAFQGSISDNVLQRKSDQENSRKSSSDSERSTWKDLGKGLQELDGSDARTSTKAAADQFKRPKRVKV